MKSSSNCLKLALTRILGQMYPTGVYCMLAEVYPYCEFCKMQTCEFLSILVHASGV